MQLPSFHQALFVAARMAFFEPVSFISSQWCLCRLAWQIRLAVVLLGLLAPARLRDSSREHAVLLRNHMVCFL